MRTMFCEQHWESKNMTLELSNAKQTVCAQKYVCPWSLNILNRKWVRRVTFLWMNEVELGLAEADRQSLNTQGHHSWSYSFPMSHTSVPFMHPHGTLGNWMYWKGMTKPLGSYILIRLHGRLSHKQIKLLGCTCTNTQPLGWHNTHI